MVSPSLLFTDNFCFSLCSHPHKKQDCKNILNGKTFICSLQKGTGDYELARIVPVMKWSTHVQTADVKTRHVKNQVFVKQRIRHQGIKVRYVIVN